VDCIHEILELGDLVGRDLGSLDVAIRIDTAFEAMTMNVPAGTHLCLVVPDGAFGDQLVPEYTHPCLAFLQFEIGAR
jgi:hypothetical protein